MTSNTIQIIGLDGIPEVQPGDDLNQFILAALAANTVASRTAMSSSSPTRSSARPRGNWSTCARSSHPPRRPNGPTWEKDARQVEVVLREARAHRAHGTRRHHRRDAPRLHLRQRRRRRLQCLGRDRSVCCRAIPMPPRRSDPRCFCRPPAEQIGVVITDSFGRPWRNGIVNVAIGVAGMPALTDYRGQSDAAGYEPRRTVLAVADEMASRGRTGHEQTRPGR